MTFQYFFFDTYPGIFLQMLPIALIVGVIYGLVKYRKDIDTPSQQKVGSVLFVCYITGLVCLACLYVFIGDLWYRLLYHGDSGRIFRVFSFWLGVNFVPDFFAHMDGEKIANVILYLPFGILYPFYKQGASWKRTVLTGIVCSAVVEITQPVFGRIIDINDIILNSIGVLISATIFHASKRVTKRKYRA